MLKQAKRIISQGFRTLGYEIHPIASKLQTPPPYQVTRYDTQLYVTCQEVVPNKLLAMPSGMQADEQWYAWPWLAAMPCKDLREVACHGTLEGLTLDEAHATLVAWFETLAVGGQVRILVPDLDSSFEQWRQAEWSEDSLANGRSEALSAFAAVYGRQRLDGPHDSSSALMYRVTHKSGYDERLLKFMLTRAGFSEVSIASCEGYLVGVGVKKVNKGERQVAPTLENIRVDHRARYELASRYVPAGARVLDVACGVGYGSWILAQQTAAVSIVGVDIHEGAIEYAREFYHDERITFTCGDALADPWPEEHYDVAVSFETVEHLVEAPAFLQRVRRTLKPGGKFICSTPNEEKMPFNHEQFPYHVRHYTPRQLEELLENAGFVVEQRYSQPDQQSAQIIPGWNGKFNIVLCRRA